MDDKKNFTSEKTPLHQELQPIEESKMNKVHSDNIVEQVLNATDMASVCFRLGICEPFPKSEKNTNHRGWCPKCGEPKLDIDVFRKFTKCFNENCGFGGGAIQTVMAVQKITGDKALEFLATEANIKLPIKRSFKPSEINPREKNNLSFYKIPEWLVRRKEILSGAKICYGCLIWHYNEKNHQCNPSYETLAKKLCVKPRMARKYISQLIKYKLIEPDRADGKENNYGFLKHKWIDDEIKNKKEKSDKKNTNR